MHRVTLYSAFAIAFILLAWASSSPAQGGLPHGSYRQTCQNISINGDRLNARCQKVDGGWNNTSIDFRNCQGAEIINDNGNLRCGGRPGGNAGMWRGGLPPGDYKRTCRDMYIQGNKLYATCQAVNGTWHGTSLTNFTQCQRPIVNEDGNLRCPK
jgi:hypothetical protein